MSRHEQRIKVGARRFMEEGEEVLSALVARPRGWTQATAGAAALGAGKQAQARAAGEEAEFRLASPMALAVTERRLLSLRMSPPNGLGIGGDVKELVGEAPLENVDSIHVKRLLMDKVVTVTVRGVPIKLEANASADAEGLVAAFDHARDEAENVD